MSSTPFHIQYCAASSTLRVVGRLDESHTAAFRAALHEAGEHRDRHLVVDLTQVDLLPTAAINVLVDAMKACPNGAVRVVADRGTIARRVLDICGIPVAGPPEHPRGGWSDRTASRKDIMGTPGG